MLASFSAHVTSQCNTLLFPSDPASALQPHLFSVNVRPQQKNDVEPLSDKLSIFSAKEQRRVNYKSLAQSMAVLHLCCIVSFPKRHALSWRRLLFLIGSFPPHDTKGTTSMEASRRCQNE